MPDLSSLLSLLKSPKVALAVFLFSVSLLFAPFENWRLTRPAFTTDYESFFVVIMFLSGSIVAVEVLSKAWAVAKRPYYVWKRKMWVKKTFFSLNLEELCVLWAMCQSGTRTIKGSSSNHILLSLREKGCLRLMSGLQSFGQLHHAMPEDIFQIVYEKGLDRIPDDFKNSGRFDDEVRGIVEAATDRWS